MKNRGSLNNILSPNRKVLYIVLGIVMISVLTLTVVYAALSTTLNINGQAEVSSASWDIHLDNVQLNSRSATTTAPSITNSTTATFTTTLSKPGDFYEFTIDVVNDGSIDAMIDGVTKTPTLTTAQAKYLNYIVEYQNGEPINNKQLVSKGSFVRLKVKLEFRKDITASDLPTASETLSLAFTVNYVQADTTGTNVTDNGVKKAYEVISGDLQTVGSEVAIGDEHFYIISSDEDSVTMLAKYNLYVGNVVTAIDTSSWEPTMHAIEKPTGKQDSRAKGSIGLLSNPINFPWYGSTVFSSTNYWGSIDNGYVYDSNSTLYNYVENYKTYLESQGAEIEEARIIKHDEYVFLCEGGDCILGGAPEWFYGTSYWTGEGYLDGRVFAICDGVVEAFFYDDGIAVGVRPVIVLKY